MTRRCVFLALAAIAATGCSCSLFDWDYYDPSECGVDGPCDDGNPCNGVEVCEFGSCVSGVPLECPDGQYCGYLGCRPCEPENELYECRGVQFDAGLPDASELGCWGDLGQPCVAGHCVPEEALECAASTTLVVGEYERSFDAVCSAECGEDGAECEGCSVCVDTVRIGREHAPASEVGQSPQCRLPCEPRRDSDGCDTRGGGQSCDVLTGTCQPACESDRECRIVRDESGALVEDPSRPDVCDQITGRCRMWGTLGAEVGDACALDTDCTIDGRCMRGDGWPDTGYCVRLDCQWGDLACALDEVCHRRVTDRPACVEACIVFGEPLADRLGESGHGDQCRPGFSCRWDGVSLADEMPNGGCVPGNYNAVIEPNVGAPCTADAECYSPLGLGRCAGSEGGAGTCTIVDCDPFPSLCAGTGSICVVDGEESRCVRSCVTSDECASGYTCTPLAAGMACLLAS